MDEAKLGDRYTVSEEAAIGLPSSVLKKRARSLVIPPDTANQRSGPPTSRMLGNMPKSTTQDLIREIESFCQSQVIRLLGHPRIPDPVTIDRAASAFTACPAPGKRKPTMSQQEAKMGSNLLKLRKVRKF